MAQQLILDKHGRRGSLPPTKKPLNNTTMQFVRFNSAFPGLLNPVFDHSPKTAYDQTLPAVNVSENTEAFKLALAAPGLKKEDFKLNVNGNKLVVSAQVEKASHDNENDKYIRKEFSYNSFQRIFTLPKTIDGDKIEAVYQDGILHVTLPKKEETIEKVRAIEVNG
jgi:HSP20 family protein